MNILYELNYLMSFILESLADNWWLLAVSVPLSVAAGFLDFGERVRNSINRNPLAGILLATLFGAFSPLCSCTVIPAIFSLLSTGVPLAPVMSFWIASPSMDPEIFFLSVTTLGWPLATARLTATLLLSLSAGIITHHLEKRRVIGTEILKDYRNPRVESLGTLVRRWLNQGMRRVRITAAPVLQGNSPAEIRNLSCCAVRETSCSSECGSENSGKEANKSAAAGRILTQTVSATLFVAKFIVLAFFLEALILRYIPQEKIATLLGSSSYLAPLWMTLLGVPLYTSTFAAMGITGGLLEQGMSPGAGLAFLISGPVTTIPAMAAVYHIVRRRVFLLYLAFPFAGALIAGYLWDLVRMFF